MNSPRQIGLSFGLDQGTISRLILGGEAALWSEQVVKLFSYVCLTSQRFCYRRPQGRQALATQNCLNSITRVSELRI